MLDACRGSMVHTAAHQLTQTSLCRSGGTYRESGQQEAQISSGARLIRASASLRLTLQKRYSRTAPRSPRCRRRAPDARPLLASRPPPSCPGSSPTQHRVKKLCLHPASLSVRDTHQPIHACRLTHRRPAGHRPNPVFERDRPILASFKISHTVAAETRTPRPEDPGLVFRRVTGRPVLPRRDRAAQRRRTMPRCQRTIMSGVTSSRSPSRRAFGITPGSAASRARSAQFSFGRRGCRRCKTASWWRRIKISAVFHASSRWDSRSHPVSRVIRRTRTTGT
jgi:hypothetical protein